MGYKKEAIKGFSWVGLFRGVTRVFSFFRTAILARILSPSQFGVYGIATLILSFLEIVTETGINVFLVQEKDEIEGYINTAWVVSIARGVIISLIVLVSTPLVILFFKTSEVRSLMYLVSLVPLIRGFINPSIAKFQKNLEFSKYFWFRTVVFILDSVVAVAVTLIIREPIGLIWGLIAGALFEVMFSWLVAAPRPKPAFEYEKVKEVVGRGKWVTLAGFFDFLSGNVDDATVGRVLSTGPLGLYQVAYKISTLPITEVAQVLGRVTFPVYVKISDDNARLKRAYLKILSFVVLFTIPMGIVFILFPREIIQIVLGPNWVGADMALRVLAIFGVAKSITITPNAIFLALKKQDIVAKLTFIEFAALGVVIVPLTINYGIVGAAWASVIAVFTSLPFVIFYTRKVLK